MDAISLIAILISLAIPALSAYLISALDMFGTGKTRTILIFIAWGAFGSFTLAYLINTTTIRAFQDNPELLGQVLGRPVDEMIDSIPRLRNMSYDNALARLSFRAVSTRTAPVIEEIVKALVLLYFVSQPRFRYFIDGAIYGFAAGIGFAMTENIFYVINTESPSLVLAISRVLSASLMHATASAVVGIALGYSRRSIPPAKYLIPLLGILFAIIVHLIYNNLLFFLQGSPFVLLVAAIGIGLGGGLLIGFFINNGLEQEKQRFNETLSMSSGVTRAERKAVQGLGSEAMEEVLTDMELMFGKASAEQIRRLFVIQANIGILKNNLKSPVGERLKKAWEEEITAYRLEMDTIRQGLGTYVMTLVRNLFDENDANLENFNKAMVEYDPMHVHAFDVFMVASKVAGTLSAEQIETISNRLKEISFFKNVALADLDNLSRAVAFRNYSHGQGLFNQGEEGDAMFLIDRGYIDVFLRDEAGEEKLLRTFQAGDVVGELALLDGQTRSASARANGSLRVMILQRQHFMMFIQSRPRVILAVLEFLAEKVRYTTEAITGANQNIQAQALRDEDMDDLGIAGSNTDTISSGQRASVGVFGRLNDALNNLEAEGRRQRTSGILANMPQREQ
jgi:CRP-like cAMP-binding protein/RsiW-degrading membrane proteinase PrsW (M82 family)